MEDINLFYAKVFGTNGSKMNVRKLITEWSLNKNRSDFHQSDFTLKLNLLKI